MAAELLLGEPLFPGDSGVDQLVEIIKASEKKTCRVRCFHGVYVTVEHKQF